MRKYTIEEVRSATGRYAAGLLTSSVMFASLSGCSSGAAESDNGASSSTETTSAGESVPTEGASGKLLHTLEVSRAHIVEFRELDDGAVATREIGRTGDQTVVVKPAIVGLANVFRDLQPNEAVPQALLDADQRVETARKQAELTTFSAQTTHAPLAATDATQGTGPTFYNSGNQSWFYQNVCVNQHVGRCVQAWLWADSGVTEQFFAGGGNGNWTAWAEPGSEATGNTSFTGDYWNTCTSTNWIGSCNGSDWRNSFTDSVQPGWWHSWHVTNPSHTNGQVRSHVGNAPGPNPTVSLAIKGYEGPPPPPINPPCSGGAPGCGCLNGGCVSGATCVGNTCYLCGGYLQQCCAPNNSCKSGLSCAYVPAQNGLACSN